MKVSSLKNITEKEGLYEITNFKKQGDFFCNSMVSDEMILPAKSELLFAINTKNENVKRAYNVNGENFLYMGSGRVYKLEQNTLTPFTEINSLTYPTIIKAPINFGNSVLIIDDNNFFVRGDSNGALYLPKGDGYFAYEDMMFVYKDTTLYFACRDDEDYLLKEEFFGRIDINSTLGKILQVGVYDNKLFVVSEYGISTLLLLDSRKDFSLSNTCAIPVAVKKDSVKFIGDKIVFISGKKLCQFYGGKIEYLNFFLQEKDYSINDKAITFLDRYAISVLYKGKEFLYTYSLIEKSEEFFDAENILFEDNGYYYNKITNEFGKLGIGENRLFFWESEKTDFDVLENKTLSQITIFGSGKFELSIENENVKKQYTIVSQKPLERLLISGTKFKISIKSLAPNSTIEKIQIKYRY